jgi:hypothetical protein
MKTNAPKYPTTPNPRPRSRFPLHRGAPLQRSTALLLALFAAAALLTHTAPAQTWQTVDTFQYNAGPDQTNNDAVALTIAADPFGNIYAAGYGISDIVSYYSHAIVRKSSNGGATWSTMDDFSMGEPNPNWQYCGVATDAGGNIFAAGNNGAASLLPKAGWIVRRSRDSGNTWQTVDSPLGAAFSVATDSAGNIYVVGNGPVSGWTARKSADGGNSWMTVDAFTSNTVHAVFCHPTAGTFAAGSGNVTSGSGKKATTQQYWYVRRTLDGGATWSLVDAYPGGTARGFGADAFGNLYVVGTSTNHWVMRKSSNAGSSWQTVDDFFPCETLSTRPLRTRCYAGSAYTMASDTKGDLFVAGELGQADALSSPQSQWTVREMQAGASSWQTVDMFATIESAAQSAASDNAGNILVAGWGPDSVGSLQWLVRRLPAAP